MVMNSPASKIISGAVLALSCATGLVFTAYTVTAAYIMGAASQADLDGTTPADPRALIANSLQQTLAKIRGQENAPIDINDTKVEINDADDNGEASIEVEAL